MGKGLGLARQESAGRVCGQFWFRTEAFFCFKPGPLSSYPDPLLTLSSPLVVPTVQPFNTATNA